MTNVTLCGDYPAPCNCDDPETHDGAAEKTLQLDNSMVTATIRRMEAIIGEYKAYANNISLTAADGGFPTEHIVNKFQQTMNQAIVATPILTVLTTETDRDVILYRLGNITRQATSLEGMRLAAEVEEALAPLM